MSPGRSRIGLNEIGQAVENLFAESKTVVFEDRALVLEVVAEVTGDILAAPAMSVSVVFAWPSLVTEANKASMSGRIQALSFQPSDQVK